jgi:hypothetical protein
VKLEDNLKNYFGINPYLFTNNNPVRYIDSNGNENNLAQYNTYFTDAELNLYRDLGIPKISVAVEFNHAYNVANQVAKEQGWGLDEARNGRTDAFRHTYLSANLAYKFGAEKATAIASAHEQYATPKGFENEAVMDSFNNSKGINLGSQFYRSDVPNANTTISSVDFKLEITNMVNAGELIGFSDYSNYLTGRPSGQMVKTNEIK